jgi:hypothetical protein
MDEISYRRIRETLQLLKETDARSRVLFTLIKNLQVEVKELRAEQRATAKLFLGLLGESGTREHAEAIVKDFMFNKNNPK